MSQFIAKPMSTDDILHLTNRLRRKLNLYDRTYFPIVEFIETVLPEIDPKFSYLYVAKNEMPDTYAYFDNVANSIVVREDVYDRALNGSGRDRFTLAHELGHYVLHSSGVQLCRSDGAKLDDNAVIGKGTVDAINARLKAWGYRPNGIAGKKFIKKLREKIKK